MANPPSGTVTFLFTDIEGSTALHENHPDQMYSALKRHDGILKDAIEANGGYVFSTGGDAFCAAFTSARDALRAALAAQRALSAEAWPENTPIRVRMGLHTGAAEERDGNYFGSPLNRTARLMSAGHGGQVLLSGATYNLVRDHLGRLEPEAELLDLGEHRLRDLKFTEHVFQLVVPDLTSGFPELRTAGLVTPRAELINLDGRFGRVRHIGGGGMGDVYLAHHEALDRDMALKVLKKQYVNDKQFVDRFKREAKSAASLSHPNIASIYDAGEGVFEGEKTPYIAMEYVPGGTLKDLVLQQREPLPIATAVELALQVARALEAAHKRGVIHRDIKPQNILLTEDGSAKVVDFGIARAAASSTTLTQAGGMLGTPHYISPEQVMGEPATPSSDLYALGVVFYEMLTGELPYDAETPVGIVMKHVNAPLRSPREINLEVPEGPNALCERLLAKNPGDRYQDASELIEDLEQVRQGNLPAFVAAQRQATDPISASDQPAVPPPTEEKKSREEAEPRKDGRYRRIRTIGEGRISEVYLAHDEETDGDVALKVLKKQYAEDEAFVERFEREARNAAALSHPNVVAVYDRGETGDGTQYMAMEYVSGGTLEERIRKDGPLPAPEAAALALQIARALQAAHEKEIIHRDVRPQNVLLTGDGQVKVADFGIARAAYETVLTQEGSILGNAHYVSPEQALGQPLSPRSDLYSLGVTLYQMLTGVLPFEADTPVAVVMKHVGEAPHLPKDVNPRVPDGLNAIVVRLLSKDPEDRYPDARALMENLEWTLRSRSEDEVVAEPPLTDGGTVDSAVSAPQDTKHSTVEVPDLSGQTPSQARTKLARVGLKLGGEDAAPSDTVTKGRIIEQDPAAGTKAKRDSSVRVTVSSGTKQKATSTGAPQMLLAESKSDRQSHPEQGEQSPLPRPTPPDSSPTHDRNGGRGHRGAHLWTVLAGLVVVVLLVVGIALQGAVGGGEPVPEASPEVEPVPEAPTEVVTLTRTLDGRAGSVGSVAFSPKGDLLASDEPDAGTVKLWNPQSGELLRTLEGDIDYGYSSIAFSTDGRFLTSNSSTTVELWDPQSGEKLRTLEGNSEDFITSVAFSPDGSLLAGGQGEDGTVELWDPQSGEPLRTLEGSSDYVGSVAFSPSGDLLASGSLDFVRLWDPQSGEQLRMLEGHSGAVSSVAFSFDGRLLVSGHHGSAVGLWDPQSGEQLRMLEGHSGFVNTVAFSPDGRLLASGDSDGTVKLWNPQSGEELQTIEEHSGEVNSVAFSPDGQLLVSGSSDGTVKLWERVEDER